MQNAQLENQQEYKFDECLYNHIYPADFHKVSVPGAINNV